jgi:hypothetical protein
VETSKVKSGSALHTFINIIRGTFEMRFTAILFNVFAVVKIEAVFFLKQHDDDVCMVGVMKL